MSHQGANITKHQNYFTYPLTNFVKCSILDVWQGFEYAPDMAYNLRVSGSLVHTCTKVDTLHMVN